MNKNFKLYALICAILFAVFNAVVFLVRPVLFGPGYNSSFWIAWGTITLTFAGNLICAGYAFRTENLRKVFYSLPLINISWSAMIATLVIGCVLMLIPGCPVWLTAVICILILAVNAVSVIKAHWAGEAVVRIDEKVLAKTTFVKFLTADAEGLLSRSATPEAKAACKKVYEALRYSDPMSNEALSDVEARITSKFNEFSEAVAAGADTVGALADDLVNLIADRNRRCRLLK